MIGYYLQCGQRLEDLMGLSLVEKIFYMEAMSIELERRAKIFGG